MVYEPGVVVARAVPPVAVLKNRTLAPVLAVAVSVAVLPAQIFTGVLVLAICGLFTVMVVTFEGAVRVAQRTWARK